MSRRGKARKGERREGKGSACQRSEREVENVLSILNTLQTGKNADKRERSVCR